MFTVTVREHMMIAHTLRGEVFGPAQGLHGATYLVDVGFAATSLDADGIVVDIGRATDTLRAILEAWNYRNLDEIPALAGINTTTEQLARLVAEAVAERLRSGELGQAEHLTRLTVTLTEHPSAWASYTMELV